MPFFILAPGTDLIREGWKYATPSGYRWIKTLMGAPSPYA